MNFFSRSALAFSLALSSTVFAAPTIANSQGLFDVLFSTPEQRAKKQRQRKFKAQQAKLKKIKRKRIASPRFFTYKVDRLKTISLASLIVKTEPQAADAPIVETPPLNSFQNSLSHLADTKMELLPHVGKALISHYQANPDFIWFENGKLKSKAHELITILESADIIGLPSKEYAVVVPEIGMNNNQSAALTTLNATPDTKLITNTIAKPKVVTATSVENAKINEDNEQSVSSQPVLNETPNAVEAAKEKPAIGGAVENVQQAETAKPATESPVKVVEKVVSTATAEPVVEVVEEVVAPAVTKPVVEVEAKLIEVPSTEAVSKEIIELEMKLTARALRFVLDATRGRVDPNKLSGYHDLPRKKVDLELAMKILSGFSTVKNYLNGRSPKGSHFKALAAELAILRAKDNEDNVIEISNDVFLKPGRTHVELVNIIAAINKNGSEQLRGNHWEALSSYQGGEEYTKELVALVKGFQKENKLGADGIIGRNTIRALVGDSSALKIAKIQLAMERSRWLPGQLGKRFVFINQPAYRVQFIENNAETISMRVVVGKASNQTNFFMDKLDRVEFNPYWGVPRSIIINEMLPKLSADPSYLDRLGYELTNNSGRRVRSSSVNWYKVATGTNINVRQPPGRKNALGALKILFPNKHLIYMHDTPAKSLFKRDSRAFSHGCVRLHDPRGMAAAVLGKSLDHVNRQIKAGKNKGEKIKRDIAIYISYFTAWPTLDGEVQYFDDMYRRDKYLNKALASTALERAES